MIRTLLSISFIVLSRISATAVTFQVDMSNEEVSAAGVHIAGSMQGWDPSTTLMTDNDGNGVYEYTFSLTPGETVYFKYVNGNAWGLEEFVPSECSEGGNRYYTVGEMDEIIPVVNFGDCAGVYDIGVVTFQADMTNFVGFDPSVHTLEVRGSFNGWGGGNTLQPDLVDPDLYVIDVTITEEVGNEVNWKFKANPDQDWENTGWEIGDNRVFEFTGYDIVLDPVEPEITPSILIPDFDVTITFAVEWIDGVLNANTGEPFLHEAEALVFNGSYLNGWYTWGDCIGDSCENPASADMPILTDEDGDHIFTGAFVLPAGHDHLFMAKFGAWYDGIDTLSPGVNGAIDNEAGFGHDRVILIPEGVLEYHYETIFGINNPDNDFLHSEISDVIPEKFTLKGNYPNPFNPETNIEFDLDITSNINVTIYSVMGEKVITLYNGQADPGMYSLKWDAENSAGQNVPSGIYLYTITSNDRMQTGKMLLLK